jgi:hypothetical protein
MIPIDPVFYVWGQVIIISMFKHIERGFPNMNDAV